jgi:plasmid stabilization system protein ParE
MEVGYHPLASRDLLGILRYYHEISPRLADDFEVEFRAKISVAAETPLRFPAVGSFRRANLRKFPYHLLYQCQKHSIRVMVIRHNKRDPDYGTSRS